MPNCSEGIAISPLTYNNREGRVQVVDKNTLNSTRFKNFIDMQIKVKTIRTHHIYYKTILTINIFKNLVYHSKHWKNFTHQLLQSHHYTNSWPVCLSIYFYPVQNKTRTIKKLWQRVFEQRIVVRIRDVIKTLEGSIRIICHESFFSHQSVAQSKLFFEKKCVGNIFWAACSTGLSFFVPVFWFKPERAQIYNWPWLHKNSTVMHP